MQSKASTVTEYLAELPEDRRNQISKVRATIRKHLPEGMREEMGYGMIGYVVPHKLYPPGYHCDPKLPLPFAALASQKNNMSLYLMSVYQRPELASWFASELKARGKKVDMGKSCIRFKTLDDLPLDLVAEALGKVSTADYISRYEQALGPSKKGKAPKTAK